MAAPRNGGMTPLDVVELSVSDVSGWDDICLVKAFIRDLTFYRTHASEPLAFIDIGRDLLET